MAVWSQEGGYADSTITIGGKHFGAEVEQFLERYKDSAAPGEIGPIPGRYRITIEQIEGAK